MLRTFKIQRMSPSRWAGAMGKDLPPELVSWCQLSACPSRFHVGWAMHFGIEITQIKSLQQPCHWVMHCLCIFTWAAMGSCPTSSFSPICQPVVLKLPSDVPRFLAKLAFICHELSASKPLPPCWSSSATCFSLEALIALAMRYVSLHTQPIKDSDHHPHLRKKIVQVPINTCLTC